MKNEYRLVFWSLVVSSFLTQNANAEEKKQGGRVFFNGYEVPIRKGNNLEKVLPKHLGASLMQGTVIGNGQIEVVKDGGTSMSATVKEGGIQVVTSRGYAHNTKIESGKQFVFEREGFGSSERRPQVVRPKGENSRSGRPPRDISAVVIGERKASAYDATVSGENGKWGEQNVYGGGEAWNTQVKKGGMQSVFNSGFASGTQVFDGGEQRVLAKGKVGSVTLHNGAKQVVYTGGELSDLLTIGNGARSWVEIGAKLGGKIDVKSGGHLYVYGSDNKARIIGERFKLDQEGAMELFSVNVQRGTGASSIHITDLSGHGKIHLPTSDYSGRYPQLNVDNLSGDLHFIINLGGGYYGNSFIRIKENSSGNHKVSIVDTGVEYANSSTLTSKLNLISDAVGGAQFALANLSGNGIENVDLGAYKYKLGYDEKSQETDDEKDKRTWYLALDTENSKNFTSLRKSRKRRVIDLDYEDDGSGYGGYTANEISLPSSLESMQTANFSTTPSTDAILSMAVASELIFYNELDALRTGRGIIDRTKKNTALWTALFKDKERLSTGHTHFDLGQTGIVLGADLLKELISGNLFIGGFSSYDQARITHKAGGVSGVNTYSLGIYATYFDHNGWYLDGIVKYNSYQSDLKAVSTNGLAIQGNYRQSALGTSFETGYRFETGYNSWVQPYSQFSWVRVAGKEIELSNGMRGDIDASTSFRTEVGVLLGRDFNVGDSAFVSYLTASWRREYIDDNHTTINKKYKFITDLSGNTGKFGLGLKGSVSDNLTLYAEVNYLKGSKRKGSVNSLIGLRYSF
ncbi:hypothetical protein H704_00473 [Bartonella bacilliformis Peru38]|uniref:Adhesin/invasin n=2 Tax=Bartonella bacilliformis TaxID=774 RepID=A0ABP2SS07_BARBA|nr:BafA family autotransporter [Bartonella bacilliformis]ABM45020.1 putative adhesin/invasin [Bartonella bacilliformis KC583]AMG86324.1 autotransporter outer membrane beta-barrel domain-containing protein [Bartonella bacilliformis]EKS44753.1 putative adhesin/invasin [Bartonella bacilliformis INS]EYS90043.1 hypothetical protein X472_00497 [Bartonella bacilliformis San Pedro600-02]EYS95054.1 hypothetical protein X470_00566 [Bartonella bacilliformis Peru-18]